MPRDVNQNPEQIARDRIDDRLRASGWHVQNKDAIDFNPGLGVAVREYQTDIGPADYVLFVDLQPVGVVEAKPDNWGAKLTTVEEQSAGYANAELKWVANTEPLPFLYEATGEVTRFTNGRDPNPRSREVFSFHRPETFKDWTLAPRSFRAGIASLPALDPVGLRECQTKAVAKLEASLKADKPRALVQMATGSGKTFTAITQVYRLLKHADARRVLFLVDTRNLGEQAEQEFMAYIPNDDNRKFTELYNVQRLTSPSIAGDVQVVISTIQRMYATLKGEELAEGAEEEHPEERKWQRREPLPVVYNAALPPEYFDVVVIDECHRSIYNLWRQGVGGLLRRLPDRPHRDAGQAHVRVLPEERGQRIHARRRRGGQGQRRQRDLPDRNGGHAKRRDDRGRTARGEARTADPRPTLGIAGRAGGLHRPPARPLGGQSRSDTYRRSRLPR